MPLRGIGKFLRPPQNLVPASDDVCHTPFDHDVGDDADAFEGGTVGKYVANRSDGDTDAVPKIGPIRIPRTSLSDLPNNNGPPSVLEGHHEVFTGRAAETVDQKKHAPRRCVA